MADHSEQKPLKSILKTGDEPPRHVGGISLTVEEGHDAEKKEHKVEIYTHCKRVGSRKKKERREMNGKESGDCRGIFRKKEKEGKLFFCRTFLSSCRKFHFYLLNLSFSLSLFSLSSWRAKTVRW